MKNNMFSKTRIGIFLSFLTIIGLINIIVFETNFETVSASEYRIYWRHDYNSQNMTSHIEYSLHPSAYNNSDSRTIFSPNDMMRDYDTSVVKLSVGGTGFIIGDHTIATAGHWC